MKKFSKWLLLLATTVAAIVCAFAFAACGDDNGGEKNEAKMSDYAGTFKFTKVEYNFSNTYKIGDVYRYDDKLSSVTLTADYFVMVFDEDGTFTVNSPLVQRNPQTSPNCNQIYGNMTGTWTIDTEDADGNVKVTVNGEEIKTYHLKSDGNEVTYEFTFGINSYKFYLNKV